MIVDVLVVIAVIIGLFAGVILAYVATVTIVEWLEWKGWL